MLIRAMVCPFISSNNLYFVVESILFRFSLSL